MRFNIIVFEEINEAIRVVKPIGGICVDEAYACFIFKKHDKFEPMIYHYENKTYGFIHNGVETSELQVGNDVIYQIPQQDKTIAKVFKATDDGFVVTVKETNEKLHLVNPQKYTMREVLQCLYDIIIQNQSLRKRMGQIDATRKDIHDSLKAPYKKAKKEYYDSYNQGSMHKDSQEVLSIR